MGIEVSSNLSCLNSSIICFQRWKTIRSSWLIWSSASWYWMVLIFFLLAGTLWLNQLIRQMIYYGTEMGTYHNRVLPQQLYTRLISLGARKINSGGLCVQVHVGHTLLFLLGSGHGHWMPWRTQKWISLSNTLIVFHSYKEKGNGNRLPCRTQTWVSVSNTVVMLYWYEAQRT